MNEQLLVSIGVPVAKCVYLREALACWTKQTYKNFEVLLSDDAAPGDVRGAVEPYLGDARFTYVRQEVNSAPHFTRNWNACLERAKGKYFVLASDDDLYAPNFLERMVALAEAHPEGDIFFAGWTMLTPDGANGWMRTPVAQRRDWESAVTFLYHRYALGMRIVAPPVLVRTEALRAIGGFADLPAAWFSDDLTWARLAQRGGVFFEPELLVDFRMAGQNVTMSKAVRWMREKFTAVDAYEQAIVPLVHALPTTNEADRLRKAWLEQGLPHWLERHRQELAWDLPFHKALPFYLKRLMRGGGDNNKHLPLLPDKGVLTARPSAVSCPSKTLTCPIMLCFNDNYVLPAGVAIWSLLHHANRSCTYPIHVVHSDITQEHQERLRKTVAKFPNASIDFIEADQVLDDLWAATKGKFSFSKDVYCKMLVGDLFPQYQRILITDVDVIFMGDIAPLFEMVPEEDFAYAGIQGLEHPAESPLGRWCAKNLIPMRVGRWGQNPNLSIGGGLLIANLDYLREHKLAEEMIACVHECGERLTQAEQDVINLVCGNVNVRLPLRVMMCSYYYPYARKWKGWCASHEAHGYSEQEVREALAHPIQLHYAAGNLKPWNNLNVPKAWVWVRYCLRSGWFGDFAVRYLRLAPALTRGFIMRCWRFGLRKMRMAK